MRRVVHTLWLGGLGVALLFGCQGSTPQDEETKQEPPEAMVEESFEGGDTGTLDSAPEEPTEADDETEGDAS